MAVRDIVRYPDPILATACSAIGEGVTAAWVNELACDLIETMRAFPGCIGIAAPQVGALHRMVVVDATGHRKTRSCHGELVLIDPVITWKRGNVRMREGCLSIPDFTGDVRRAEEIEVEAYNLDGELERIRCDAYEARVILHEIDHLDGILFLDRVASAAHIHPRKTYQ
mgnify:CR=1 FL=1